MICAKKGLNWLWRRILKYEKFTMTTTTDNGQIRSDKKSSQEPSAPVNQNYTELFTYMCGP